MKVQASKIIHSHTALRGLAALYVLLFHLCASESTTLKPDYSSSFFWQFFRWGGYAVMLFFILSGFILFWVYMPQIRWTEYFRARFARILPLYYLSTLCAIPVALYSLFKHGLQYVGSDFPMKLWLNLFMVSGIVAGVHKTLNPTAWSISVEFFCYVAVFPVLVYFTRHLKTAASRGAGFVALAGIFSWILSLCHPGMNISFGHTLWDAYWLSEGVAGFVVGFSLCGLYQSKCLPALGDKSTDISIAICIATLLLVRFELLSEPFIVCVLPLLVFASATDRGFFARIFKIRCLQWLGERSYSIYLWHSIVMVHLSQFARSFRIPAALFTIAVLVVTMVIAEVSYRYFELPIRNFFRRRSHSAAA